MRSGFAGPSRRSGPPPSGSSRPEPQPAIGAVGSGSRSSLPTRALEARSPNNPPAGSPQMPWRESSSHHGISSRAFAESLRVKSHGRWYHALDLSTGHVDLIVYLALRDRHTGCVDLEYIAQKGVAYSTHPLRVVVLA